MKKEEACMNTFLSYVHMAANVYRIYQQKATNLQLKSLITEFIDVLCDHEKKVKYVIENLNYQTVDSLKMMQKMTLAMERLKSKMIEDDFKLAMDLLKTTNMGLYQALNFVVKHKNIDYRFVDVSKNIIKEYDTITDKIRSFIEKSYM